MIRKEESVADILNELTLPRVVGFGSK